MPAPLATAWNGTVPSTLASARVGSGLLIVLAFLSAVAPFATDLYLPPFRA